jgi:hypothetical protein
MTGPGTLVGLGAFVLGGSVAGSEVSGAATLSVTGGEKTLELAGAPRADR